MSPNPPGDELRKAREKAGLTPEQQSFQPKVDRTNISMLEHDKKSRTLDIFGRSPRRHPMERPRHCLRIPLDGCAVVTLAKKGHAGRMVASALTQVAMSELIAPTPQTYVEAAVRLGENPEKLAGLRSDLREQMRRSALCDAKGFSRILEEAYRTIWQTWTRKDQ